MFIVVALLCGMSTADGLLTIYEMESGFIEETNPLMNIFLEIHPVLFMLVKGALVVMCCAILWEKRERLFAKAAAGGLLIIYLVITCWHVHNLYYIHSSL